MRADALALDLPVSAAAPGLARRALEQLDLATGERENARLVASELVTNAVLHSGAAPNGSIRISAAITGRTLRLTVTDPGNRPAAVAPRQRGGTEGGFGLLLVDQLAIRWGVEPGGPTTVWCELSVGGRGPADEVAGGSGDRSRGRGRGRSACCGIG